MISGVSTRIDFNPSSAAELPEAMVKARFQVAALKTEQDMMAMQMSELARLIEPHKGQHIDARA
jgi:hypothetical protein